MTKKLHKFAMFCVVKLVHTWLVATNAENVVLFIINEYIQTVINASCIVYLIESHATLRF